jgi:hypothetical protein
MIWQCPQCMFILHKMLLRGADGAVGINMSLDREVCPNDGVTLILFKEDDEENMS